MDQPVILTAFYVTGQGDQNRYVVVVGEEFQEQDWESGEPWSEHNQWVGKSQRICGDWGAPDMQKTQCPASFAAPMPQVNPPSSMSMQVRRAGLSNYQMGS